MTPSNDFRALRSAAEAQTDAWTRGTSSHLHVPTRLDGDDPTSTSAAHDFLALFLARFFGDRKEIERVFERRLKDYMRVPDHLRECLPVDHVTDMWAPLRGIALNVWVQRISSSGLPALPVRIFQDYRRIDGERDLLRAALGTVAPTEDARALWARASHQPYFALTRALEPHGYSTLIAFLAANVNALRPDFVLALSFSPPRTEDLIYIPPAVDMSLRRSAAGRHFYTALFSPEVTPGRAADDYLSAVFGLSDDMDAATLNRRIQERLGDEHELAEQVTKQVTATLFRDQPESPLFAQTTLMLTILRRFYLVTPGSSYFYVLPIFHTAKPLGAQDRLRTISTVGLTSTAPLRPDVLDALQATFHALCAPLQMTDYRIQEEARAAASRAGRFSVVIHHIKHDATRLTLPLHRYKQLLELAHDPRMERVLTDRIAAPAQLAAELFALTKISDSLIDDIAAALAHPDNMADLSCTVADVLAYVQDRLVGRDINATIISPNHAVLSIRLRCATLIAGMAVIELIRNADTAGKIRGGAYSVTVEVTAADCTEPVGVTFAVRDSCGGFDADSAVGGLRRVLAQHESIVGGTSRIHSVDGGTIVSLTYPVARQ